ncbi:hypothetical protein EWG10_00425 [Salmonella enterica subsp. enterica serovar Napoli]|nr:hypothetical protein [Salmonella enterica]EBS1714468.1 hypothetical protein [Salmonella enterica subsp. enterica serovar Napoli]EBZ8459607.1 hypothetical protein [Salmonella enterica subsp. enterica serovar Napoli]EBZ8937938.1 hypothetical protein [Salmonella enterica subsp. enterica serovar Napoli]EBZ9348394.1 hypothetical protein [Salmonella enterica subsp. enterica serovar Napoli]
MLLGTHSLVAFKQLELFWVYTHCLSSCRRVVCAVNPQSLSFPAPVVTTLLESIPPSRGAP